MAFSSDPEIAAKAEKLSKIIRFRDMSDRDCLTDSDRDKLLSSIAASDKSPFDEAIAEVLGANTSLALSKLVTIYPLPFHHVVPTNDALQKKLATLFGYVAIVGDVSLKGAQVFFIDRSAISLAEAVQAFSSLSLLK